MLSSIGFIEQRVATRRCDQEAVAECVRCSAVAVGRWLNTAIEQLENVDQQLAALRAERDALQQQACDISLWLSEAGIGPCPIPEGVRLLLNRAEQAEAERDAADRAVDQLADDIKAVQADYSEAHRQVADLTRRGQQLAQYQICNAGCIERASDGEWVKWADVVALLTADPPA